MGKRLPFLICFALMVPWPTAAQQPRPAFDRWSVSVVTGPTSSGPASDLEAAMRREGFDDNSPCFFGCDDDPSRPEPFSRTSWGDIGFPWQAEVRYRHSARIGATFVAGRADIGSTHGYRHPESGSMGLGDYLSVSYGVRFAAAMGTLFTGRFQIDLGPVWYNAASWQSSGGIETQRGAESRIGVIAGGGAALPIWRSLSAELRAQYRGAGKAVVGPFTVGAHEFPEVTADFSHTFLGLGVSARF